MDRGLQRTVRKLLGVVNKFLILIVEMVSQVVLVKANQVIHLKYVKFCMSITFIKKIIFKNLFFH